MPRGSGQRPLEEDGRALQGLYKGNRLGLEPGMVGKEGNTLTERARAPLSCFGASVSSAAGQRTRPEIRAAGAHHPGQTRHPCSMGSPGPRAPLVWGATLCDGLVFAITGHRRCPCPSVVEDPTVRGPGCLGCQLWPMCPSLHVSTCRPRDSAARGHKAGPGQAQDMTLL